MNSAIPTIQSSKINLHQLIKLIVYALLLINFALYIRDDWVIAAHTMRNGGSFLKWTAAFATTIDESAWVVLLILFELETYVLSDAPLSRPKAMLMHSARVLCYVSLAHTLYAYGVNVHDLSRVTPIAEITSLCQLIGSDISYAVNLAYTALDAVNCASLASAPPFFHIDPPEFLIVTDSAGLAIERQLAWIDILEASTWLLILFAIEMTVWLQERGIGAGVMIKSLNMAKFLLYSLLWGAISYWIYRGHWMFAWDEFVWIAGFVMIEANVVEWRNEIVAEDSHTPAKEPSSNPP